MNDTPIILIVDDDPLMLTGVAAVLNMSGYECHCARDSEAALKAVRGLTLDLIICDMNVDGDSGLELCQEMRSEPGAEDVPVIFVSTEAKGADAIKQLHAAGGFYYLRKPFDHDVLVSLVDKALWMPHLVNTKLGLVEHASSTTRSTPNFWRPAAVTRNA